MSTRHEDNDGSDIFWPGYVDATTNLILNLLFLLTILMVAVFMFALELGRSSPAKEVPPPAATASLDAEALAAASADPLATIASAAADLSTALATAPTDLPAVVAGEEAEVLELSAPLGVDLETAVAPEDGGLAADEALPEATSADAVSVAMEEFSATVAAAVQASSLETQALQQEIARLNNLLAEQQKKSEPQGGLTETVEATAYAARPAKGLDKALATDTEVVVRFLAEAIEFTPAEHDRLFKSLQPIVAGGHASIYVEVPAGFSEAKRMGFYRAMTVRNLLIEMELPQDRIDLKVIEGSNNANASIVRVRPQ